MKIDMKRWKKFCQIHSKELIPFFNAYEVKRRRVAPWIMLCEILFFVFIVMFCIYVIFCAFQHSLNFPSFLVPCFIIVFSLKVFARLQKKKFKNSLKKNCMQKVLKVFDNIKYKCCNNLNPNFSEVGLDSYSKFQSKETCSVVNISQDEIRNSKLFTYYNIRKDDDLFNGNYNGVDFKILETQLLREKNGSKENSVVTVFEGVIAIFSSNKKFTGQTTITTKGNSAVNSMPLWLCVLLLTPFFLLGIIIIFSGNFDISSLILIIMPALGIVAVISSQKAKKLEEIKLEATELSKKFIVHSTDQVEARYLLTPSFIERFMNLKTAYDAKKIQCSFFDDKIMFAISTNKDLFEIGHLYKSLHDPKSIYKLYNELSSIEDIIEHFKFNEKIGL